MRKFTRTEWLDLARGCRALATMDEESRLKNERSTMEAMFARTREHHLEMAKICEYWARLAPPD
jgi:hypothetical protein